MDNGITQCSLAELVEDPLIGLVMKSDRVDRRSLELLLERVARDRARPAEQPKGTGLSSRLSAERAAS